MNWDAIQSQWQSQNGDALDPEHVAAILLAARSRNESLHQRVRRRDRLETVVGLLLAPFFVVAAFIEGQEGLWVTVAGCALLVAAFIYIPIKLRKARRLLPKTDKDRGLVNYLRDEHKALSAQVELLRSVPTWYLTPIGIGVLMVFIGFRGATMASFYYTLAVLVISGLIYLANISAVSKQFAPRLQEIEAELESLGETL